MAWADALPWPVLSPLQKRTRRLQERLGGDEDVLGRALGAPQRRGHRSRDPGREEPPGRGQHVAVGGLGPEAHRARAGSQTLQPRRSLRVRHVQTKGGLPAQDRLTRLREDPREQTRPQPRALGIDHLHPVQEDERVGPGVAQIRHRQRVLPLPENGRRHARGEDVCELPVEGGLPQRGAVQRHAQVVLAFGLGLGGPLEEELEMNGQGRGGVDPLEDEGEGLRHPSDEEVPQPDVGGLEEPGLVVAVGLEGSLGQRGGHTSPGSAGRGGDEAHLNPP
jgi:hypothetical protein